MFINYQLTRALVAERQSTLRHEAREHRRNRRTPEAPRDDRQDPRPAA